MIKVTVIMNGVSINIDRDLLPKDSTGREYDHIIDERDDFGVYKIDEEYYNEKEKTEEKKNIEIWFQKEINKLDCKYSKHEIELFPSLEKEAIEYINKGKEAVTPLLDYILLNIEENKYHSKNQLSLSIVQKADYRRETILSLLIEKKNKLFKLN